MAGGLSIHVVDVSRGVVAAGMRVEVYAATPSRTLLCAGEINAKGVLDEPVLMTDAIGGGYYEAVFHAAAYYRLAGAPLPAQPPRTTAAARRRAGARRVDGEVGGP